MTIGFDAQGKLTAPAQWFTPNQLVGGKIRATETGQVMGLIAEWGVTGRGSLTRGVVLAAGSTMLGDLAQSLVITADMEDGIDPIAATVLSYGAEHYNSLQMANPHNAMILATPFLTARGIGVAGCVHPEAVAKYTLGGAIGRINSTAWSLEGARDRGTGVVSIGSVVTPGVLGTAVTKPGYPLERLAAADTATTEGVVFVTTEPTTASVEPYTVVPAAAAPAEPAPVVTQADVTAAVQTAIADVQARQAAEQQRATTAALLREPL